MQRRDVFKSVVAAALGAVSLAASAQPYYGPRYGHRPPPPGHRPPPPPRRGPYHHMGIRRGPDGYWRGRDGHRVYCDRYGVWRYMRDNRRYRY